MENKVAIPFTEDNIDTILNALNDARRSLEKQLRIGKRYEVIKYQLDSVNDAIGKIEDYVT